MVNRENWRNLVIFVHLYIKTTAKKKLDVSSIHHTVGNILIKNVFTFGFKKVYMR